MGQAKQRGSREDRVAHATSKVGPTNPTFNGGPSIVGQKPVAKKGENTAQMEFIVSTLLSGKEIAEFDEEVTGKLDMETGSIEAVRAEHMQLGLRNSNGEIYRAIGVTGLGEFLSIVQYLADIGLVDELKDATAPRGGYDAIFSA